METQTIRIFTDGSCHAQSLAGAWAAIVFIREERIELSGLEFNTTHNRMELLAVIKAIEFIDTRGLQKNTLEINSDSQYVVNLPHRKEILKQKKFITNRGVPIRNIDLVTRLIQQIEHHRISFVKIKAHQKNGDLINREVDLLVRNIVRKNTFTNG